MRTSSATPSSERKSGEGLSLLLAHSHRFPDADGLILDDGRLGDLRRYTQLFESVQILARSRPAAEADRVAMVPLVGKSVSFESTSSGPPLWSRSGRLRLKRLVKISDAVVVRLPSVAGSLAAAEAKKQNKPLLVEMVGCPWDAYWNHSFLGKLVAPVAYMTTKMQVGGADYVIYVTEHFLQSRYPTRGESLACSDVVFTLADNFTLEARFERIQQYGSGRPLILATTAPVDVSYKGQSYVIRAIAKLQRPSDDLQYWLIGGGDQSRLRRLARTLKVEDNLRFIGSTPHERVLEILRDDVDLYVQPSLVEGMPRALLEAMAIGCPAVGTRVGGIPEILNWTNTFEKRDIGAICHLIDEVTSSRLRTIMEQNFYTASRDFDSRRRADEWIDFVRKFRDSLGGGSDLKKTRRMKASSEGKLRITEASAEVSTCVAEIPEP